MTVLPETTKTAVMPNVRGENGVGKKLRNHADNGNGEPNRLA